MVQPVCPELRKCRVHPGSYAWCQYRKFDPADIINLRQEFRRDPDHYASFAAAA